MTDIVTKVFLLSLLTFLPTSYTSIYFDIFGQPNGYLYYREVEFIKNTFIIIMFLSPWLLFPFSLFRKNFCSKEICGFTRLEILVFFILFILGVSYLIIGTIFGGTFASGAIAYFLGCFILLPYWFLFFYELKNIYGKLIGWVGFLFIMACYLFFISTHTRLFSVYTSCSSNIPLKAAYGNCYSCDKLGEIPINRFKLKTAEKICPNRIIMDSWGREVSSVPAGYNAYSVLPPSCPQEKPIYDMKDGLCYPCDDPSIFRSPNCENCPNRENSSGFCRLK